MAKNLLIVESPAKAKTIEKYLGKDFKVKSSYGHVRDLKKSKMGIDVENDFQPNYEVSPDKTQIVKDLKQWVNKVDHVWLATDEDREGEAISWHLAEVLGLDKNTKRIVFREITKSAIQGAIKTPRVVDQNLVNAQQARRILDRLVGFELSELLWKKVRGKLSAGRVQSVAVKLVVDKERDIQKFESSSFFKVKAQFIVENNGKNVILEAILPHRLDSENEAKKFVDNCVNSKFDISNIQVRPGTKKPSAPFTTSTLQQEASRKLGFSVKRTMVNAQRLYEAGFISYMRTDSLSLSQTAVDAIVSEISDSFGDKYVSVRQYKNKSSNAQEAHEAIRPAYFDRTIVTDDRDQQKLYALIWKRAVASQMADAKLERTTVDITPSTMPGERLVAKGEVLLFDGFLKVYMESKDEDMDEDVKGILPPLKVGQALRMKNVTANQGFTKAPARYSEAGLVKKMEEMGIGRPSTYAPTISKIMEEKRGYVIKDTREGEEKEHINFILESNNVKRSVSVDKVGGSSNRLFPTDMGMIVSDFLTEHFSEIMDYGFTAEIEKKFDQIADGKEVWNEMVGTFYHPFHKTIVDTIENADRASGERKLGKDPKTGRTLLVRMSRFGPVAQIGTPEEIGDEKPKYASLRRGQSMESISFEDALELFKLPRTVGQFEGKDVVVAIGRFGPYVSFDTKYVSLPKDEDPMSISLEKCTELILEKRRQDAPIGSYKDIEYTKGVGRFGPFLKWNGMFINIPRKYDPDNLSVEDQHELIEKKIEKEANRYIHQWPEDKLAVENGRWGPFIRFKKKSIKLPKINDKRMTSEEAKELSLEEVKQYVVAEIPDAFTKKTRKKATKKKATKKKK